jgi:GDPmannose 4,6-dehydratase
MRALITGVCGQDGWYLSEFLRGQGYEVIGTRRGNEEPSEQPPGVEVVFGDVTDALCMRDLCDLYHPDEIYNLAAITHVGDSFSAMAAAFQVNTVGAANCLDAAARIGAKVYQASTSELFGDTRPPQDELSPMRPRSPYAVAKYAAYWLTRNYRERGVHAVNGILFNHESVRRGGGFVTQKVARGAVACKRGDVSSIRLGNLNAMRDWGHAKDFVRGMWMLMQQPADDWVLATGRMHSVGELCEVAFGHLGLDWRDHVEVDPGLFRPLEVEQLCGDPSKARSIGWAPEISFEDMIKEMVDAAAK